MENKQMTEAEIMKALECCAAYNYDNCAECPLNEYSDCDWRLPNLALDLINRKNAENEELRSDIAILKQSNINLQEFYYTAKEKAKKAKEKVIGIAKALQNAKAENERLAKDRYLYTEDGKIELLPRTDLAEIRAKAIKEVYTRLSMNFGTYTDNDSVKLVDLFRLFDQIAKEMGVEL